MPAHTVGNLTTVAVMWRLTLRVGPQVLIGLVPAIVQRGPPATDSYRPGPPHPQGSASIERTYKDAVKDLEKVYT
ncbi:hypothetical protein DYI20_07320 [Auritidibacter ignavus]|uniref:hypothetical protein n=1 Tax=Auritidibacter TaxID=1160973 RepID=UPI000F3E403F|nr:MULTISPECIES: hypothetical protein [Auritidibacter]RMX22904.1 hypothetical protein DYI20_07320 [Auritidibacter ignavus]WHS35660.1 hypothetical protein QM403_03630 [Auritidibacter ignavus]